MTSGAASWRPRLRTVLLIVNLLILLLPLGGIAVLRLAENELIRSTEAQLIVQCAHVREAFRAAYVEHMRATPPHIAPAGGPERAEGREGTKGVEGTERSKGSEGANATDGAEGPDEPTEAKRTGETVRTPATAAAAPEADSSAHGSGVPLPPGWRPKGASPELPDAIVPGLDISRDRVRPPEPDTAPATDPPDPVAAAAGAEVMPALQAAGRTTLTGIRIVDSRGVVVATTRTQLGHSFAHREEFVRALAGEAVSLIRERVSDEPAPPIASTSRAQRYRVIVALPVIESDRVLGAVIAARTPMDIQKALYLSRGPILAATAVLLGVVVLVSVLTASTVNRPLRALIGVAERVARGEKVGAVGVKGPGTREAVRLAEALSVMARTLEERSEYIRTFASHVSHEFKTPLAALKGTVELLRDHEADMAPAERARFLGILSETSERLEKLVNRLLELARADVLRPGEERTPVKDAIERVAQGAREAGLRVDLAHDPRAAAVRMARETLEEVLSNLLDNARQHGGPNVRVRIASQLDAAGGAPTVVLTVSDDGPGVSGANADRIFTPFFTTARERGGTGLGLSIVRSILEAHGGSIALEPGGPGASFRLRLPLDPSSG